MSNLSSIIFPHLGIELGYFPRGITLFGKFEVAFYGIIVAVAMILATIVALRIAKKTNQCRDDYIDLAIAIIISGIIGARLYYILFNLDYYLDDPIQMLNIRGGGLAIYGGLIGAALAAFVVCRVKKLKFLRVSDTVLVGVALAQGIGRWVNFINREAFGEYTDGLFAMQIRYTEVNPDAVTELMRENMVNINGVSYVQVSPTFLYESMWCLALFILLLIFRRFQQYNGEVTLWYVGGYAAGRVWIEGLRTDALHIGNTGIAVSQLLSVILLAGALAVLVINRIRIIKKTWQPDFDLVLAEGEPGTNEFAKKRIEERKAARRSKDDNLD